MGYLLLTVVLITTGAIAATIKGPWRNQRLLAISSFLIVWVTPLVTPTIANSAADLKRLRFGWPIQFLEQNSWLTPPTYAYPVRFARLLDPQETPTHMLWGRFALSIALVAGLLWTLLWVAQFVRRARM